MLNNPYDILGVGRSVSEQQLMDAYRRAAAEIQNSQLSESEKAAKMSEIDGAYDYIVNEIRGTGAYAGSRDSGSQAGGASQFSDVRRQINSGRIDDAETILNGIPASMRNAEWYYLKGMIHQRRGWLNEAYRCYSTAYNAEPGNAEYAAAYNSFNNNAGGGYRMSRSSGSGCSACDVCSGLLCADCCCECMGGDLIPGC